MTCGHGGFLKCFMTLSMFSNIVGHPIHVDGHIETIGNNNVVHTIYQLTIHNIGGPCCRFQYSIGFKIWCAMYNSTTIYLMSQLLSLKVEGEQRCLV